MLQPADAASFKPLKNLWKTAVLKWRQSNSMKNMTLETMAPILFDAVETLNSNRAKITKNGFRACGLYPWNANSVDYSKCLASSNKIRKVIRKNMDETEVSYLSV